VFRIKTPPLNYRQYGLKVTDLSSQLWCEKQLEFSLLKGRKKTAEMQQGEQRHQDLHEEIAVLVDVEPKTLEDTVLLKLHNSYVGLHALSKEGMTREIPVWGTIHSLDVVGVIDELILEKGTLKIVDTKTRRSNRMPTEAQKRTTRFQLMLYKYLFDALTKGAFTSSDLLKFYHLNKKSSITEDLQNQLQSLGEQIEPNISTFAKTVFTLFQQFHEIHNIFEVRYEHQASKNTIGIERFEFNAHELNSNCAFAKDFWVGKREARVVNDQNRWKCRYCEFTKICPINYRKLDTFR
jgi:exonuclease V